MIKGDKGNGILRTILGTQGYMAPEIVEKQPYQGMQVDLFSAGVILYIMRTSSPPFVNATDKYYKILRAFGSEGNRRTPEETANAILGQCRQ